MRAGSLSPVEPARRAMISSRDTSPRTSVSLKTPSPARRIVASLPFQHLTLHPHLAILDLACGTGFPLFELAQVYGSSCQVTGIDLWKEAVERARSKLNTYQFPNMKILEADAAHLPFQESEFDLIVSNLGANNFTDPYAVFAECFRVAKPKARIVLTTNITGHMSEFYAV